MTNRLKWTDKTDAELIQMLQTEIERIGVQDNPRRVVVQERYNNENMPSPTYYERRFNRKWRELVEMAGFTMTSLSKRGARKKYAKWLNMSDEGLLRALKEEITRLQFQEYPSLQRVKERHDDSRMPPPRIYLSRFDLYWKDILERAGIDFEKDAIKHYPYRWHDKSDKELLELLKAEVMRLGLLENPRMVVFQKEYNNDNVPSPAFYLKHFNCGWAEVLLSIGIPYGKYKNQEALLR